MNKKSIVSLVLIFLCISAISNVLMAQNVVNGVMQGSPRTFMKLPQSYNSTTDWAKPSYGSSYSNPTASTGVTGWGTDNHSHAFITRNANGTIPTDCAACYQSGSTYIHLEKMPLSWNTPDFTDGQMHYEDTVIQVGCDRTQGTKSQQMEYKFIPDENNPVLLVNYMLVMENKESGHGYPGSSITNPTVTIEVQNANTGQLLNLGYYPSDYVANGNEATGAPNTNWPYARYLFIAPGSGTGTSTTLTPSAFTLAPFVCPRTQACNVSSDAPTSVCYDFNTVAFNLTEQAATHTPVKFIIKVQACSASAHWAYIYYTAKMAPGKLEVNACGENDIEIKVPYGFDPNTYEWYSGNSAATATYDNFLNTGNAYRKVINRNATNLKPYYRCEMFSKTGVPFVYEANLQIYSTEAKATFEQIADECHNTFRISDSSVVATLVPNTVAGGYDSTRFENWNRRWRIYDQQGNLLHQDVAQREYTYRFPDDVTGGAKLWLEVSDPDGACGLDTVEYDLEFDPAFVESVQTVDTIITCEENLPVIFDPAYFGDQHTWHDAGTRQVVYEGIRWNGCDSTVNVAVIVQKPQITVQASEDFCDEFVTTLSVNSNVDVVEYLWSTDENTPTISVNEPGTYAVTITDEGGCTAENEIIVPACKPFVNLPTAITPSNQDGLNDCVEVLQRSLIESLEFTVYSRSGEVVYSTTDKYFCWDGRVNGKLYPGTVYNWVLQVKDYDGYKTMFKGSITVL